MVIAGGRWCPLPSRVETGYQDGDHVFVGVHERQLDPKGRLALPAAFRPRLEPRCYLAFGQDMCVDVLSAEAFEAEAAEVLAKVRRGEMDRNQMRALASNIEEQLREYAGLSLNSKVVVSGAFDRVEIWEPLRFGRINTKGTVQIAGADA